MIYYFKLLFLPLEQNNYRPGILEKRYFFILVVFLCGLKILSFISYERFLGADIFNSITQTDFYSLTNNARQENQLPLLKPNAKLEIAARMKLNDMLQNNYFAHVSPSGVTPWIWIGKSNYNYVVAGENLAMNFYDSNDTMKAWLNSELHRKNILLPEFKEIGIAVGSGMINNQKTTIVVQVFGSPKIEPIIQISQKPSQLKPLATKMSQTDAKIMPKSTPKTVIKPTILLPVATTIITTPIIPFIPTTFSPSNIRPSVLPTAQIKSDISLSGNKSNSYALNLFLQEFMVIMFAVTLAIMLLKIFVNINIQIPELALRGIILIFLSAAFISIKDQQIAYLLYGNVTIP